MNCRASAMIVLCFLCYCVAAPLGYGQKRISQDSPKPRIAVLPFDKKRLNFSPELASDIDAFAEASSSKMISGFVDLKRLTVLDRSAVDKIIKEQNFQTSDLSDPDKTVSIGKFIGADILADIQLQNVNATKKDDDYRASV